MSLFNGPIAGPPDRSKPVKGERIISNWQVTYLHNGTSTIRDMAVQAGFRPPEWTQWDGQRYRIVFLNTERLNVTYTRE